MFKLTVKTPERRHLKYMPLQLFSKTHLVETSVCTLYSTMNFTKNNLLKVFENFFKVLQKNVHW